MNTAIHQYEDFMMSNEERDFYIDPIIMGDYKMKTMALKRSAYSIKSKSKSHINKLAHFAVQLKPLFMCAMGFCAVFGLVGIVDSIRRII